jgi:hypothetical protein
LGHGSGLGHELLDHQLDDPAGGAVRPHQRLDQASGPKVAER